MPDLVLKETGEVVTVAPANLARALSSGLYEAPESGATTQLATSAGLVDVPIEQAGQYQQNYGDAAASPAQLAELERGAYLENEHGGTWSAIGTGIEQGLNEATFGATGFLGKQILGEDYRENMEGRAEIHDTAAAIGSVVGVVAPAIASGGTSLGAKILAKSGAGVAARVGEGIAAKAAGRGLVAETAAAAAGYGVEGAMLGSGHVLAETVLHDKELSAEAFVAGAQEGALWGGAGGGAASLLSRGTKWAKSTYDDVLEKRASVTELQTADKVAQKEAAAAAKLRDKLILQRDRQINQQGMEELRQKGRLDLVEARGSSKLEAIDASAAARKDVTGYTAEQKLKLEEYKLGGKKELAEISADARLKQTELGSETKLRLADKALEKELAKAEAKVALTRAKAAETSERLLVEQERTARAKLVMDGRLEIADTYTGGWKRAAESREAVAASKLDAASLGADARTRVGLADAIVKSGRQDAGVLVEELIPARMRTPAAMNAARSEVVTQAARMRSVTDDLVRQADEVMAANPAAAEEIHAMRNAAAESAPGLDAWGARAASGGDNFAEGFTTIRTAEQAQHDLAQALRPHVDEDAFAFLDEVTAGMDAAVGKTDEIVEGAVAKQIDAATGANRPRGADGTTDAAAMADLLVGAAGLPNADDIPVIGPVLGAYLKFRAVHGALGKIGIRLPGPVGRIAQVGASVQNKASEVVGAIITHAPAAAKVVERAAPSLTATLSRPLWEPLDSEADKKAAPVKGDPLRLLKKRIEELERAVGDPEGTRKKMLESIPAPPSVANAIADQEMRKLEYLHSQVPADPRPPTVRQKDPRPNMVEVRRFCEAKRACEQPVESIKDVIDGKASPRATEAVRTVFPRLFQAMQEELLEKMAELETPIPFARLVRAALVFDIPLDHQTSPEYGAARQAEYAAAAQAATQPTPGGGPQLQLSNQEAFGATGRAMR